MELHCALGHKSLAAAHFLTNTLCYSSWSHVNAVQSCTPCILLSGSLVIDTALFLSTPPCWLQRPGCWLNLMVTDPIYIRAEPFLTSQWTTTPCSANSEGDNLWSIYILRIPWKPIDQYGPLGISKLSQSKNYFQRAVMDGFIRSLVSLAFLFSLHLTACAMTITTAALLIGPALPTHSVCWKRASKLFYGTIQILFWGHDPEQLWFSQKAKS